MTSEDDGAVDPWADEPLCEFVDRHTVRYVRELPHDVERVWEALTDPDELARWFFRPIELDLRVGGRYEFGPVFRGTIQRLDPPRVIKFDSWRFELEPTDAGCRLVFTTWLPPEIATAAPDGDPAGRDQPWGPGTPWPGALVGWHGFISNLRRSLDDPARSYGWPLSEELQREVEENPQDDFVAVYREHIRNSPIFAPTP